MVFYKCWNCGFSEKVDGGKSCPHCSAPLSEVTEATEQQVVVLWFPRECSGRDQMDPQVYGPFEGLDVARHWADGARRALEGRFVVRPVLDREALPQEHPF